MVDYQTEVTEGMVIDRVFPLRDRPRIFRYANRGLFQRLKQLISYLSIFDKVAALGFGGNLNCDFAHFKWIIA